MSELLLESVEPPAIVQKIDGIAVSKEMGMDLSLEVGTAAGSLDDLVSPLLGYMTASAGGEQIIDALECEFLSVEQDGAYQTILDEHHSFPATFAQYSYAVATDTPQR